jgi:hypothetical protein
MYNCNCLRTGSGMRRGRPSGVMVQTYTAAFTKISASLTTL